MSDGIVTRQGVSSRATRIMLGRFLVYAMVGAAGTAGHYAFLITAVSMGMMGPVPASVLGAIVGAIINFVLNTLVTFRGRLTLGTAGRFFATAALAAAANGLLMSALLASFRIDYRLAQLLVTAVLLCITFGVNSAWTYRATKPR
ncbi:GtrA family protein [Massilia norwichensis]|jgi:putative flippase GtrA|uniref:GtrA family protein n=1 Tax=Massilia norwichensis TaxID=1442366 RepID=A0ABT2A709_9BURK|nr:GtrA family protein [Massilia norwichensis]MCS0589961.1 GtrA family protein [Massilia norwichensis]